MKILFEQVTEDIMNMSDEEFEAAMKEAECEDLRWLLEYAHNPFLEEYAQWRLCYRHMWE